MVNFSLEGKVALVTGASYGIGLALATAFARAGAKIRVLLLIRLKVSRLKDMYVM